MPLWLIVPGFVALLGLGLTLHFCIARRRKDETATGMRALGELPWTSFLDAMLAALAMRDLARLGSTPASENANLLLQGKDGQWLLACRHRIAYRIGSATLDEIAAETRLRGARGGLLATEATLEHEVRERAAKQGIEAIDGVRLWQALKPVLPHELRTQIAAEVNARAIKAVGATWLVVLVIATASFFALKPAADEADPIAIPAMPAPASLRAIPSPSPAAAATSAANAGANVASIEEQPAEERNNAAAAIGALPGITRTWWMSGSTLVVERSSTDSDAMWKQICGAMARYPSLDLTRVQLNPAPGSGDRVHWRQCGAMAGTTPP